MAPEISSDALMVDLTRMRDDNWDEGNDPTRRVTQLNKGKSVKQSTGIRQDEEHISHKRFEDLAHAILRAMGSPVPKQWPSPVTLDAPPQ